MTSSCIPYIIEALSSYDPNMTIRELLRFTVEHEHKEHTPTRKIKIATPVAPAKQGVYPTISPQIFNTSQSEAIREHLNQEGYVVIGNILTISEQATFLDTFTADLKTVSPKFSLTDKSTWTIKQYPGMYGKGACVFNGFGQSDFMWTLRTNKQIQSIFKKIYQEDELVVSMDGFSLFVNKNQTSKRWHHVDQNPFNEVVSYQSAYNYLPVKPESAGFVIAPTSHIDYVPAVKHQRDWILIPKDSPWNSKVVKLLLPKNCLTIWNSKAIHANVGKMVKSDTIDRLSFYIAYLPKRLRTTEVQLKRIQAYKESKTCSHWSNQCQIKRYPFGFKKNYEKKGLGAITATLNSAGNIPTDRLKLI